MTEFRQLEQTDRLEYLFLFHRNGYLRKAALDKIRRGLPSPFLFAAVASRLNDWVPEVRQAAVDCATIAFPLTPAYVIAATAIDLLERGASWGRWDSERQVLEQAFIRPDVAPLVAKLVAKQTSGPLVRLLRQALRHDGLDPYLMWIAQNAVAPAVRAAAVEMLANGFASWPDGFEWQWTDKAYGLRHRVVKRQQRPLTWPVSAEQVVRFGLNDKSMAVRKAALDALIRHRRGIPDAAVLAAPLMADRCVSVRERAAFLQSPANAP